MVLKILLDIFTESFFQNCKLEANENLKIKSSLNCGNFFFAFLRDRQLILYTMWGGANSKLRKRE